MFKEPRPAPRRFFERPTLKLARALLGCNLVRRIDGKFLRGRIVEVEAYTDDDASHSKGARRTPRNAVMFGPPGVSYVYFTYGMHHCFNVVSESDGLPGAVLIRGLDGIAASAGPALLCRALQIGKAQNRLDLTSGEEVWIEIDRPRRSERIIQTSRIGIRAAVDLPWRFYIAGSPGVSKRDRAKEGE